MSESPGTTAKLSACFIIDLDDLPPITEETPVQFLMSNRICKVCNMTCKKHQELGAEFPCSYPAEYIPC